MEREEIKYTATIRISVPYCSFNVHLKPLSMLTVYYRSNLGLKLGIV